MEDESNCLANLVQNMDSKLAQFEARLEYQENYSRKNNIRNKGVPEGMKMCKN